MSTIPKILKTMATAIKAEAKASGQTRSTAPIGAVTAIGRASGADLTEVGLGRIRALCTAHGVRLSAAIAASDGPATVAQAQSCADVAALRKELATVTTVADWVGR